MSIRHNDVRFRPVSVDDYDRLYFEDPADDFNFDLMDEYDKRKEIVQRALIQSGNWNNKKDDKKDTEQK